MVHIVLDSTANVPSWLRQKRPNLHVVPLTVRIGTREMAEDELTADELFTLIQRTGQHPQTSQPAPGEFVRLFGLLTAEGSDYAVGRTERYGGKRQGSSPDCWPSATICH